CRGGDQGGQRAAIAGGQGAAQRAVLAGRRLGKGVQQGGQLGAGPGLAGLGQQRAGGLVVVDDAPVLDDQQGIGQGLGQAAEGVLVLAHAGVGMPAVLADGQAGAEQQGAQQQRGQQRRVGSG